MVGHCVSRLFGKTHQHSLPCALIWKMPCFANLCHLPKLPNYSLTPTPISTAPTVCSTHSSVFLLNFSLTSESMKTGLVPQLPCNINLLLPCFCLPFFICNSSFSEYFCNDPSPLDIPFKIQFISNLKLYTICNNNLPLPINPLKQI